MLQQKSDERILGDSDFVESVQAAAGELLKKRTRYQQQEVTFVPLSS